MTAHYNDADKNLYHAIHSDVVGELLHPPRRPPTPDKVKKFRRAHYPDPGIRSFHWGIACDPSDKPNQVHGTKFGTQTTAPDVVNPPVPPQPYRLLADARRLTYDSNLRHPVGSVPLRQPAIPPDLEKSGLAFGVPTKYGVTVAECVSPFRNAKDFQENWCKGTDLYRRSHLHYNPGEQVRRCYGSGYSDDNKFGTPTPHDITGRRLRECMTWPGPCAPLPAICSARAQNWRDMNQNKVGEVLDKFECTRDLPADFTYGKPFRHELSNSLDVATARTKCCMPAEDLAKLDLILATRRRLQTAGFTQFIALMHTLKSMDKLGTKRLPLDAVLASCCQMCVPLSEGELRQFIYRLNLAEGPRQLVIYALFVATLNWKDRLTVGHLELLKKECHPVEECQTTTQCELLPPPPGWKVDRPRQEAPGEPPPRDEGPRRDRVVDVVRPTPFTELGLRETELTKPRSEAFLMELMCGMGVCDYNQFKILYANAKERNPPNPSVLDIVYFANKSCCENVEAPKPPPPPPEQDGRPCAGGLEEVKTVAESRTCRGIDKIQFIPPSLGGERKQRFEASALEKCGDALPKPDPACPTDFQEPYREAVRKPCAPEPTSFSCPRQPMAPDRAQVGCPAAPPCPQTVPPPCPQPQMVSHPATEHQQVPLSVRAAPPDACPGAPHLSDTHYSQAHTPSRCPG